MKEQLSPIPNLENAQVFEGMVSIRALLDAQKEGPSDRRILAVLYLEERQKKNMKEYAYLCHRGEDYGFPVILAPKEEIEKRATGNSHGGVLALCTGRTVKALAPEDLQKDGFFAMMEGIEDPYNFGYALRSLYAAGVDGVILTGGVRTGSDGILARSSAGASERMPLFTADPAGAVDLFKSKGYKIVSADLPDSVSVYEADLTKPLLLVIGGERRGITRSVLEKSDAIVRLDYGRPFEAALSAASAASILAFEVFRQNRG
jgi:23S rRNA (guanosine2251-2'-O)-methyltransferase